MTNSLIANNGRTMSRPFAKAIIELGHRNPRVVALTADLGKYTDLFPFKEAFPNRYFQIGMAEQNLFGVAAGMAQIGLIAFVTTYGVFATRRANEQIAIDINYSRANVKLICGLPGLTTPIGASHQATDDLAIMRAMPGMAIIDPCDAVELYQVTKAVADLEGPVYVRLQRGDVPIFFEEDTFTFEFGHAKIVCVNGNDVLIISLGLMTRHAFEAVLELEKQGIRATLIHVSTLKPFDEELILGQIRKTKAVVTCENHSIIGGLGSCVAELAAGNGVQIALRRVGVQDVYGGFGSVPYLFHKYGLDPAAILDCAKEAMELASRGAREDLSSTVS